MVETAEIKTRDYFLWDTDQKGFGVRIRPSGNRIYFFKYRSADGRQRKYRIGQHGNITVDEARKVAKRIALDVANGDDPAAQRTSSRTAPTMRDLCERYLQEHAETHKKASSIRNDRAQIKNWILPTLGHHKAAGVNREDVSRLHHSMNEAPYQANRVLALLSKMFNLAELWGWRTDGSNPCRHVKRFKEDKRSRYLSPEELSRLSAALTETEREGVVSHSVTTAIRLLILTGCRLNEILTLEWEWVDFENQCLLLPDSKTGAKTVHLGTAVLALLSQQAQRSTGPFVIPGQKLGSHLINLQKPWRLIRKRAGLDDVRLHDLRHTFASFGVSANLSLPMIGGLLGHKEVSTTQRYAHLASDPQKAAAEQISRSLAAALDDQPADVIVI